MSLASIEEEGKKADALWQEVYGEKKPDKDKEDEKTEGKALDLEPKPEDKKPEDAPPKEEPKPEDKKPEEDYKHKYDVLKGKYDAEVPRMAFDLAEANKAILGLSKEVEQLKKPKEEPKPESKPNDNPVLKKFKEEYPEIYEGANELANQLLKEKLSKVDKIDKIEEKIEKVEGSTGRDRYLSKLDADTDIGKEWREINSDPEFLKSLEEIEPYTGAKRYDLLMDSWNKMEPERTLRFFKDFKASRKPVSKAPETKKVKDEDIHPPRGQKGSDNPKGDDAPTVTVEDWKKFTKDVIDGKYKGREAEADKEEKRLMKGLGVRVRQT